MSVRGAGLARHSLPGPQPRSSAAQQSPRRRRVFLAPAPAPQRPLPAPPQPSRPEREGAARCAGSPLPARSPRGSRAPRDRRRSRTAEAPGRRGRAAAPTCGLRPAPAPNVRARRSGETGRRGAHGRPVRERDAAPPHRCAHLTPREPGFYGSLAFMAGQDRAAEGSRSPVLGSTHACGPAPADADLRTRICRYQDPLGVKTARQ